MTRSRTSKSLTAATGRDYDGWFGLLDGWGAPGRPYAEIAGWLTEQGVSTWWAQKLIVEYEQNRGIRKPGARPDGSYTGGASKTMAASAEMILDAFTDSGIRQRWLPDLPLRARTVSPPTSARFDCPDDDSRIQVTLSTTSSGKTSVAVEHGRLPDSEAADRQQQFWRKHLGDLKALLETRAGRGPV